MDAGRGDEVGGVGVDVGIGGTGRGSAVAEFMTCAGASDPHPERIPTAKSGGVIREIVIIVNPLRPETCWDHDCSEPRASESEDPRLKFASGYQPIQTRVNRFRVKVAGPSWVRTLRS